MTAPKVAGDGRDQLRLRGGCVVLGSTTVLADIDFHLSSGEFVVLLGANGSGKTTLVRALLGLTPLAAGRLELFGTAVRAFSQWERVGYVPQRFNATSGVPATALEVVLSGRLGRTRMFRSFRQSDRAAAQNALELVEMADRAAASVATLSGGQQQRVLIARALAGDPDLLVLDEPVSGVDLEHQSSFAATLESLNESGHSVLLVAHALGVLEPLISRAVILEQGRVVYEGPPYEQLHDSHVHHHPHGEQGRRDRQPSGEMT